MPLRYHTPAAYATNVAWFPRLVPQNRACHYTTFAISESQTPETTTPALTERRGSGLKLSNLGGRADTVFRPYHQGDRNSNGWRPAKLRPPGDPSNAGSRQWNNDEQAGVLEYDKPVTLRRGDEGKAGRGDGQKREAEGTQGAEEPKVDSNTRTDSQDLLEP